MVTLFNEVFRTFTQLSGQIVFQFLILSLTFGGLYGIIANRKLIDSTTYHRAWFTFALILILQTISLVVSILNYLSIIQVQIHLNMISSFVFSFSALWLMWLWCYPSANDNVDGIKYILGIALVLVFSFQISFALIFDTYIQSIFPYLQLLWFLLSLVILFAGLLLLSLTRKNHWLWGILFSGLHLAGLIAARMLKLGPIEQIGILQIAQLLSYPLLPTIVPGLFFGLIASEKKESPYFLPIANEDMAIIPDQKIFQSWLKLAIKNQGILIINEFLRNLAMTFKADHCFLVSPGKQKDQITIDSGFSSKTKNLNFPIVLDNTCNTVIKRAFQKNLSFTYKIGDYYPNDLLSLFKKLGIKPPANVLFFPVCTDNQKETTYGIMLVESNFYWGKQHIEYLSSVEDELVQILQKILSRKETFIKQNPSEEIVNKSEQRLLMYANKNETPQQTIQRLESELRLSLEENARVRESQNEKSTDDNP